MVIGYVFSSHAHYMTWLNLQAARCLALKNKLTFDQVEQALTCFFA